MADPVVALFCGSRHWTDTAAIAADVAQLPEGSVVVHGGADGADRIAGRLPLSAACTMRAWTRYGRSAGPRRNAAMLMLRPDVVYAYPQGGPGTAGMIALARDHGVRVVVRDATVPTPARPTFAP